MTQQPHRIPAAPPWEQTQEIPNIYTFPANVRFAGMVSRADLDGMVRLELERLIDAGEAGDLERIEEP